MAWTTAVGVAEVLVGRVGEVALVSAFADRAKTGGEALLLFGEPGAGKTALLDAAADVASESGTRVLRAAGVEFEADLSYSGLYELLLPVFGEFGRLSAVHRDALNAALGFSESPPAGRLLVSAATLTLLRQVASARPVLVIIDDLPWLDRASAGVLGFVARRLAGSCAGFLAASRLGQWPAIRSSRDRLVSAVIAVVTTPPAFPSRTTRSKASRQPASRST
jgi:predicted ATPase